MVSSTVGGTSGAIEVSGCWSCRPPNIPGPGAMSDVSVGPFPQVFVVDRQASPVSVPTGKKARWSGTGQKILLVLMGFTVLGLVVQAHLIYSLYGKVEAFSHCMCHPFNQNVSSPRAASQQGGTINPLWQKDDSGLSIEQIQQRPFAQVIGSSSPSRDNNVVQWEHKGGETSFNKMGYSNGRLLVHTEGHYYLYSKLTFNVAQACSLVQHKFMKNTKAYGEAIELMKSKSFHCNRNQKVSTNTSGEDLRNSFLAGIFHLERGDKIYVTLENIEKIHKGPDNIMGAFMIAP